MAKTLIFLCDITSSGSGKGIVNFCMCVSHWTSGVSAALFLMQSAALCVGLREVIWLTWSVTGRTVGGGSEQFCKTPVPLPHARQGLNVVVCGWLGWKLSVLLSSCNHYFGVCEVSKCVGNLCITRTCPHMCSHTHKRTHARTHACTTCMHIQHAHIHITYTYTQRENAYLCIEWFSLIHLQKPILFWTYSACLHDTQSL